MIEIVARNNNLKLLKPEVKKAKGLQEATLSFVDITKQSE